jgi:hypothetical protein
VAGAVGQGACGAGAVYTDPCYANCTAFNTVDTSDVCYVNCSRIAYDDLLSPCYQCVAGVNCDLIGGACALDPTQPCGCNYAFHLDNCSQPLVTATDPGYVFLVWFLGVGCLTALSLYAALLLVYLIWAMPSASRALNASLFVDRNMPVTTTILCFLACSLRIFYYVPDPYAFHGTRVGCSAWSIDYFSTFLVSSAFATVCWQWVTIVTTINTTSKTLGMRIARTLLGGLRIFLVVMVVTLFMCAIASSTMSCVCAGVLCPYSAPDFLYWISWQVFNGIAILCCCVCAILVIAGLQQFKARHRRRIRFFTLFIVGISVGMLLLLGYTISLLLDYASSVASFLAAESLEEGFIVVVMVSILVLLTVTRSRGSKHNSLAAHISTKDANTTRTGVDKDTASDVLAPSNNISALEYDEEDDAEEPPRQQHMLGVFAKRPAIPKDNTHHAAEPRRLSHRGRRRK